MANRERMLVQLAESWQAAQPLHVEVEQRLWRKLRLDWNYNSNHIEGNTLTYGETELLFKYNQTRGGHDLREYEEMKAHDVAITRVRDLAADEWPLTEAEIRTWNDIILKEPFWKNAITPGGEPTRKQIVPGRYKIQPNSVVTPSGEIFQFASPMDVPPKMAALIGKINQVTQAPLERLADDLAEIHHEFVMIHPFDDGNGRVARLIVNFVLIRKKLVPLVVPSEEKMRYITALQRADDGSLAELAEYFEEKMIAALGLGLKAARGENIEDRSDVEKRVLLLERQMKAKGEAETPRKNVANLRVASAQLEKLFSKLEESVHIFDRIFQDRRITIGGDIKSDAKNWRQALTAIPDEAIAARPSAFFYLKIDFAGRRGVSQAPIGALIHLDVFLEEFHYRVVEHGEMLSKTYSEQISEDEADEFVQRILDEAVTRIQREADGSSAPYGATTAFRR